MKLRLPVLLLGALMASMSSSLFAETVALNYEDGFDSAYNLAEGNIYTYEQSYDPTKTGVHQLVFANNSTLQFDSAAAGMYLIGATVSGTASITGGTLDEDWRGWTLSNGSSTSSFTVESGGTLNIQVAKMYLEATGDDNAVEFSLADGASVNVSSRIATPTAVGDNGAAIKITGTGTTRNGLFVFTGSNGSNQKDVKAIVTNATFQIGNTTANTGEWNAGDIVLSNGNVSFSRAVGTAQSYSGAISGAGAVTVASGTLNFTGTVANTVTSFTIAAEGTLAISGGAINRDVTNNGTLNISGGTITKVTNNGTMNVTGDGTLNNVTGNNASTLHLASGTLTLNAGSGESTLAGKLVIDVGATLKRIGEYKDRMTISATLSGGGTIFSQGPSNPGQSFVEGTGYKPHVLSGDASQFTGTWQVASESFNSSNTARKAALELNAASVEGEGYGMFGGVIEVTGWDGGAADAKNSSLIALAKDMHVGGLAGGGGALKNGTMSGHEFVASTNVKTLTVGRASGDCSFGGSLGSEINLVKTGGNKQSFTGDFSAFNGTVDVQQGVLRFDSKNLALSSATIGVGATLEFGESSMRLNGLTSAGATAKLSLDQSHLTLGSGIDSLSLSYSGASYLTSENTGTVTFTALSAAGEGSALYLTATGNGVYKLGTGVTLGNNRVMLYQSSGFVRATADTEGNLVASDSVQELNSSVTGDHSGDSYYSNGGVTMGGDATVGLLTLNGATDARSLQLGSHALSIASGGSLVFAAEAAADAFTVSGGTLKTDVIDIVNGGTLTVSSSLQPTSQVGGAGTRLSVGSGGFVYNGASTALIAGVTGDAGSSVSVGGGSSASQLHIAADTTFAGSYIVNSNGSLQLADGVLGGVGIALNDASTLIWGAGNTKDYSAGMTVVNGASVTLNTGSNNITFRTALSATGATYTKTGAGTLALTQTGALKGSLKVEEGKVSLGASGNQGIVHGTITVGKQDGSSSAMLILAGNDATGWGDSADRVTSLTVYSNASVRIDTSEDHKNGNQTFNNMAITLAGGNITGGSFDMFGTATFIHATGNSTIGSHVRFRQSGGNGNIFDVDNGVTLTVSGKLEEDTQNGVDFFKKGAGTLVLQNAGNDYARATHIDEGTLRLDAGAKLGNGTKAALVAQGATLEIAASTLGNEVQVKNTGATANVATITVREGASGVGYSNVKIGGSGIATADASGRSEVRDASVQVGANQAYGIADADLVNTLVDLQTGATVTLSNVSFNESSSIAVASGATGATATLSGTSLTLGTLATYTGDTIIEGHTYAGLTTSQFAGATMGSGTTLTLDLTNSLLMSEGLAGKQYLAITLEGFTAAGGTTFDTSSFALASHLTGGFAGATPSIISVGSLETGGTVVYVQFAPAMMPEPATATLSLLGLGSLLLRRRRKA